MAEFRLSRSLDLDLGSGHTAYRHASLIDLYLHTKFHWNQRDFMWTDGRTYGRAEGHLRLALLGWLRGVDLKRLNWLKWPLEHDTCGLEEPCIGQGWDPHGQEQCLGLSGPLTSIASVCCGVCCKSDHSVFNDGKSDWTRVSVLSSLLCDMNGIWTVTYLFQLSAKVVFLGWPSFTWSDFWKEY